MKSDKMEIWTLSLVFLACLWISLIAVVRPYYCNTGFMAGIFLVFWLSQLIQEISTCISIICLLFIEPLVLMAKLNVESLYTRLKVIEDKFSKLQCLGEA